MGEWRPATRYAGRMRPMPRRRRRRPTLRLADTIGRRTRRATNGRAVVRARWPHRPFPGRRRRGRAMGPERRVESAVDVRSVNGATRVASGVPYLLTEEVASAAVEWPPSTRAGGKVGRSVDGREKRSVSRSICQRDPHDNTQPPDRRRSRARRLQHGSSSHGLNPRHAGTERRAVPDGCDRVRSGTFRTERGVAAALTLAEPAAGCAAS